MRTNQTRYCAMSEEGGRDDSEHAGGGPREGSRKPWQADGGVMGSEEENGVRGLMRGRGREHEYEGGGRACEGRQSGRPVVYGGGVAGGIGGWLVVVW